MKVNESRAYRQVCGIAQALDLLGERWTLLILRDLMLGPLRFGELLELEAGIGANLLTRRLKRLRAEGLVDVQAAGRARVYSLTDAGEELRALLLELGRFGGRYLSPATEGTRCFDWFAFSLQRRARPAEAASVLLLCEGRSVLARSGPTFRVHRSDGVGFETRVQGALPGFVRWLALGHSLGELRDAGVLRAEGDEDELKRFERAFREPAT